MAAKPKRKTGRHWRASRLPAEHAWLAFAEKIRHMGLSILSESVVPQTEKGAADPKVIAITLLIRTLSNFKGAIALVRQRMIVEGRVLTRCCYENLFWIVQLEAEGDEFVKKMRDDELKSNKARGEFVLQKMSEIVPKPKMLNPKEVAIGGVLDKAYLYYSQLSADAAHPTVTALKRYITEIRERGESVRALDVEPEFSNDEIIATLDFACNATIGACVGVNQIVGGTPAGQTLLQLADEYNALRLGSSPPSKASEPVK
jgi:hypothetical protein